MEGNGQVECKVETIKQIVVIEDDVVDLWRTVGASRGLTTDADVCRFLLSLYFSDGQDATHGARCGQCNSLLTLVCVTCQRPSHGPLQQGMSQIHTHQGTPSLTLLPSQLLVGNVFLPTSSGKELYSQQLASVQSSSQQLPPLPFSSQLAPSVQPSLPQTQSLQPSSQESPSLLPSSQRAAILSSTQGQIPFQRAVMSGMLTSERITSNARMQARLHAPFLTSKLPSNSEEDSLTQTLSERDEDSDGCLDMEVFDGEEDSNAEMTFKQAKKDQKSEKRVGKNLASRSLQSLVQSNSFSEKNKHSKTAVVLLHKCDMTSSTKQSDPRGVRSRSGKGKRILVGMKRRGLVLGSVQTADKLIASGRISMDSPDNNRGSTFICPNCSKEFKSQRGFSMHLKRKSCPKACRGALSETFVKLKDDEALPIQQCLVQQDLSLSEDTHRDSSEDTHRDSSEDTHRDSLEDTHRDSSEDTHRDPLEDTHTDPSVDTHRDRSEDTNRDSSEDTHRDSLEDTHVSSPDTHKESSVETQKGSATEQDTSQPAEADQVLVPDVPLKAGPKGSNAREKVKRLVCNVPGCPYATNWTHEMKSHIRKHDRFGPLLKLVEKKAKLIQQCKVPSCPFETDRNFDMKKHMARHEKYGPQWRSVLKRHMPLQHCCIPACSFSTTRSQDMQRHMSRHDKGAVPLDIPKKPDPVGSPAPNNLDTSNPSASRNLDTSNPSAPNDLDTSNPSAPNDLDTSNLSAPKDLDTSNPSAPYDLDTSNLSAPNDLDTSNPSAPKNLDTSNLSTPKDLDTSNPSASRNLDTSNPSAPNDLDTSNPSGSRNLDSNERSVEVNLDPEGFRGQVKSDVTDFSAFTDPHPRDLSGQVIFDLSEFGVEVKADPSDSSAQEKPGLSAQETHDSSNTTSQEKHDSSNTTSQQKHDSSDTTSQQKHDSSDTTSQQMPESSDSSSQQKPESSDSNYQEKHNRRESKAQEKCHASDSRAKVKAKRYRCNVPLCTFATNRVHEMLHHMRRNEKHGPQVGAVEKLAKPPQCCKEPTCLFATTNPSDMERHMEGHTKRERQEPEPFWMPHAERSYRKGCRVFHCRVGDCTYTCYDTISALRKHMLCRHASFMANIEMPLRTGKGLAQTTITHLCDQCGMAYKTEGGLRLHKEKVHMGFCRYRCEKCDHGFISKSAFSNHMLQHEDVTCRVCGETLPGKKELQLHMKTIHPPPTQFACEEEGCQSVFSTKSDLTRHTGSKHKGRNFVCPVCGLILTYSFTLIRHMRTCHKMTVPLQRQSVWKRR